MSNSIQPVLTGQWDNVTWELFEASELPDSATCTAVGCIAITDLAAERIAMTRNTRSQDRWEILAGHIEPGENLMDAVRRESDEEAGFIVSTAQFFGYRKVTRNPDVDIRTLDARQRQYPSPSYIPYFYAFTNSKRKAFSGEEVLGSGEFTLPELEMLTAQGRLHQDELLIIRLGLKAAQNR